MQVRKQSFVPAPRRLSVLIGVALFGGLPGPLAHAACVTTGLTTVCDTSAPNPSTGRIGGQGASSPANQSVTLRPGAQLTVGNTHAISLGDNATILLEDGAVVSNSASATTPVTDGWGARGNTIEFGSNGKLTISANAKVQALGTDTMGEAVNVMGGGNTIINYGLISAVSAPAIWFQDLVVGVPNAIENYGIIESGDRITSNVIGNSGNGAVTFYNHSGASVHGSLNFGGGSDSLLLAPHSTITGNIGGGGGNNTLILYGEAGSDDTLTGAITNFQSIRKDGDGKWTLTGSIGNNSSAGGAPLAVQVRQGTLALTGNNSSFNGSLRVELAGTLEARAQSLPPSVINNGLVLFNQPDNGTYAGTIGGGTGHVAKSGAGILTLSGANTYGGQTYIDGGSIAVGADNALGNSNGKVLLNGGALVFNNSFSLSNSRNVELASNNGTLSANAGVTGTLTQVVSGAGTLTKDGPGTIVLANNGNSWAGGTIIAAGTLQLGSGGVSGSLPSGSAVTNNGTLLLNRTGAFTVGNLISGSGGLSQIASSGIATLTGDNSYAGPTTVTAGTLYVNGAQTGKGAATVASGATLGGTGKLGGNVTIQSGGTLAPGGAGAAAGTLTIDGDLTLQSGALLSYSLGQAGVTGGALNDLTNVGGNLALGGTLNVSTSTGGTFGPGVYRLFNYGGARSGSLTLGTMPVAGNYFIQTSVDKQVNLVNADGLTLNYWDGDAGPKNNGVIDGGSGTWRVGGAGTSDNWTNTAGTVNAAWSQGAFAVFAGQGGNVKVDSATAIQVQGMQFAANGYTLVNNAGTDALTLTGAVVSGGGPNEADVRVGDGSAGGAGYTANIAATLAGAARLVKTDLGTLVLSGVNTYAGGTVVKSGTLQVAQNLNLGAASGALSLDGGTLAATASFNTGRAITLGAGSGGINVMGAATDLGVTSAIGGSGALTKLGDGSLTLQADNSYTGGTTISGGILHLGGGGGGSATGSILGNVTNNGNLVFNRNNTYTFAGVISGTGSIRQFGGGTTVLTADNSYTGGTTITLGTLQLGEGAGGSMAGSIVGDVINRSALIFNRSNTHTYAGVISDIGSVTQRGNGTTVLSGDNTYTGGTTIVAGALQLGAGGATGGIVGNVVNNGSLIFNRGNTYTHGGVISGAGNVVQRGAGTTVLGGVNTYTGGTAVNSGTLQISQDANLGNAAGALSLDGGTLATTASFNTARATTLGAGGGGINVAASTSFGMTSAIGGSGALSKGGAGTLTLHADNVYAGGTTITAGTLQLGAGAGGAATGSISGNVANNGTLAFNRGNTYTFGGLISGSGGVTQLGNGATVLTANNTYTGGTTITAGILQLGAGAGGSTAGGIVGDVTNNGSLLVNRSNTYTLGGAISGTGSVTQQGNGTTVLTAANTYTGGTTITAGVLQLGAGGTTGSIVGNVSNNGALAFNRSDTYTYGGTISGTGSATQQGNGTTILTANNTYTGGTTVDAGSLYVNGDQTAATGATTVNNATLGGKGVIGGDVTLTGNSTLSPGDNVAAPGTLTIKGNLALGSGTTLDYSFGEANVVGGPLNDLIVVAGDVSLGGKLNVALSPGGSLDVGVYRVISYDGTLSNAAGLTLGTLPTGADRTDYFIQTSVDKQVNLTYSNGLTLNHWDGGAGPKNNSQVNGGSGTWVAPGGVNDNWTDVGGRVNAGWNQDAYAIFSGQSGTVRVDSSANGAINVQGMQFATDGYVLQGNASGDKLSLTGAAAGSGSNEATIRVGDGTAVGAGYTATIATVLDGAAKVVKTDLGTLALSGVNTYTGGTAVNSGTVQVSRDANLGAASGALSLDGGTLAATASFDTGRAITVGLGGGGINVAASTSFGVTSAIGGSGALSKGGAGTLTLHADNVYAGGTTITAGTLQLGAGAGGAATGSISGNVANNGTLAFNRGNTYTFGGLISGSGGVTQLGNGATVLTANNTYTGGTTITAGILQLGAGAGGSTAGGIVGDVTNNGSLLVNRSNTYTLGGAISGTGSVTQQGNGATILTAANTYTGGTTVSAGSLYVNGDQTAATGATTVNNATLGGKGVIGGDVTLTGNSTLSPGDNVAAPGTLTIKGNLALGSGTTLDYSFGEANVVGGPLNDLIVVAGDVSLGGKLNVALSPGGSLDVGVYRVISYDGTLSNAAGLTLGTLPTGADRTDYFIQTSVDKQVNLTYSNGLTLNHWDGGAGPKNNSQVNGGSGTWVAPGGVNDNWTDVGGRVNAGWNQDAYAIFSGQSGTVLVDSSANGAINVQGMQFAVDGYVLQGIASGDKLSLKGSPAGSGPNEATIRVGDGTAAGAGYTATIATVLDGAVKVVKTDLGTLALSGVNTYTGGTAVNSGTVQVSQDANLGAASGALSLDGGTLAATASFDTGRAITVGLGDGGINVAAGANLGVTSAINGSGALSKGGAGTLTLHADNVYAGGTTITAGTLQLGTGGTAGAIVGDVANNGALAFNRSDTYTFGGRISGSGAVTQMGSGTTVLTADNRYTGLTTIAAGTLQLGAGGATGGIVGDVVNNGSLIVNRGNTYAYGGAISGSGSVTLQGGGATVLTGDSNYTGGTLISASTLQLGAGGTTGSILGDVTNNGALVFNRSDTYAHGGAIVGSGSLTQQGGGTTVLTADNRYTGGTMISAGALQLGAGGTTGSITGDVSNNGALVFNRGDAYTFGGLVNGSGTLTQAGAGVTVLTADHAYTGGTTISAGTLRLGDGGTSGSVLGKIVNNAALAIDRGDLVSMTNLISGSGRFMQTGAGQTVLSANNTYTGTTEGLKGSLYIDGDQSGATGATVVRAPATLGGAGIIGGDVSVDGTLSPGGSTGVPGTLTINGKLTLDGGAKLAYSFGQAGVVGGPLNDLTIVKGDLVLGGKLDVVTSPGGRFDPGVYRVISYGGALTDNGLAVGSIPSPSFSLQTAVAGQVNLVNTGGLSLNVWDGSAASGKNNSKVDGGDGHWQHANGNNNWTNTLGTPNASYSDASFAIFMAAAGKVTVDNSLGQVRSGGMQFASDGYRLLGDAVELVPDAGGGVTMRVGDGTGPGSGYTATIDAALTGDARLVKTDLGTLVLNGANRHTGGTDINAGTVQIASDTALGAAGTAIGMNGGTLRTTQNLAQSRAITLGAQGGSVEPQAGTTLTLASSIGGAGSLTKLGDGTAILTGSNSYGSGASVADGVTLIKAGTLQVGNGGTSGNIVGTVSNEGVLAFNRADRYVQAEAIKGSGKLVQRGSGTTVLNAVNAYTGGTTVTAGALAVGDASHAGAAINGGAVTVQGGATFGGYGSVKGDVSNAGTLAVADALPGLGGGAGAFAIAGNLSNSGLVNLAGANPGNRLTVTGNYQGQSGALSLNAYLGADASPSDKLVVDGGAATGATALRIINKAGPGVRTTGDGIQVVQAVNGGTTSSDAFTSAGVYAGAYAYMLFRGGVAAGTEQNWYLRSEIKSAGESRPIYRPGVALYGAVPSLARELAVQQIGTFHDRRGNEERFGDRRAGWARTWGDHLSEGSGGMAGSSFSGNTYGMQAGQDLYARTSDSGHQDRYGVFLGYASANGDVRGDAMGQRGYRVGKLGIQSHSVGAYWTHVGPGGWYTDTVILGSRLKVHPTSNAGDTRATRGRAFTASVEAGLPIALKPNLSLEPQAQIIYQNTRIDSVRDAASEVSFAPKNAFIGRVGARLQGEYQVQRATWKPYARVDLEHTLGGRDKVSFSGGATTASDMGGTQARLGLGVAVDASERVSVSASASYGFNLGGERRETVQGNLGVRIRW